MLVSRYLAEVTMNGKIKGQPLLAALGENSFATAIYFANEEPCGYLIWCGHLIRWDTDGYTHDIVGRVDDFEVLDVLDHHGLAGSPSISRRRGPPNLALTIRNVGDLQLGCGSG